MQHHSPKKPRLEENQNILATNVFLNLRCANLVLPWLTPQDLAAVSLTCISLALISKSFTLRRSIDAARSLENLTVPFCDAVDGHRYAYFLYIPRQVFASSSPASSLPRQSWGAAPDAGESGGIDGNPVNRVGPDSGNGSPDLLVSYSGSDLASRRGDVDDSDVISDSASGNGSRRRLESAGGLGVSLADESGERVSGCGCVRCNEGSCPCLALAGVEIAKESGSGCPNRVTLKGISVRLKIARDVKKDWCLFADQFVKQGQFICEYAGELLTTEEARQTQITRFLCSSSSRERAPSIRTDMLKDKHRRHERREVHQPFVRWWKSVDGSVEELGSFASKASRDINPDEELRRRTSERQRIKVLL